MVQAWWAAGLAVPVVVAKAFIGGRSKSRVEELSPDRDDDFGEPNFVCERVCTSDKLTKRLGSLAKDVTPNNCVTVCGVSASDACTEACQRAVCVNPHQVPAWNEACLKRCTAECLRGKTR